MEELYKIIIADDEFIIRDGLEAFNWGLCGFTVTGSVSNGKKVLQLMDKDPADVIITDIKMPIMDGLELAKILNSKYPKSKIVILTGFKDFDYARAAISSGVSEYLLKPVDLSELELLFHRLKEELDNEQKTVIAVNNFKKQLSESLPAAIEDFFRGIIDGKINDSFEIAEKINLLELVLFFI
jgi:two-component system, response regulator YesN